MHDDETLLRVHGCVRQRLELSFADLMSMDAEHQVPDVSALGAKRPGHAVRFEAILSRAELEPDVRYVTLHANADNFHVSVPLESVREQGLLIYGVNDGPLPTSAGGPVRFFIPDPAACQTAEVDECASVKFLDTIEFSRERGFDNRPEDEAEHRALHEQQGEHPPEG